MAIYDQEEFDKSPPAQYDGLFGWDYLNGAFPRGIMPMDFDGVVEIKGNLLIFETKKPGATIPIGQAITLDAIARQGHTVLYIWGKSENEVERVIRARGNDRREINDATSADVIDICKKWAAWADSKQSRA